MDTPADNLYFIYASHEKLNRRELLQPRTGRPEGWTPPAAFNFQQTHEMLLAYVAWIIAINHNMMMYKLANKRDAWITYNYLHCSITGKFPLNYSEFKACAPDAIEPIYSDMRAAALLRTSRTTLINTLSNMMVEQTHIVNELLKCFKITDIK